MVKVVEGNLLDMFDNGDFDVIAHGCNCLGVMGAGIALQIKNRYPMAFYHYIHLYETSGLNLGDAQKVKYTENGRFQEIYNLMTQYSIGIKPNGEFPFDIIAYQNALEIMIKDIKSTYVECETYPVKVGIPRIGSGLAGGDAIGIEQTTREIFEKHPEIELTIVDFKETK